ncbi:hypothetical protein GGR57DRAFT_503961 [Xylariaceae sp. FL1272]|nr:hypothetical protein GGR57DRAFT_503961 [Xylariaceae sp. FL1272]
MPPRRMNIEAGDRVSARPGDADKAGVPSSSVAPFVTPAPLPTASSTTNNPPRSSTSMASKPALVAGKPVRARDHPLARPGGAEALGTSSTVASSSTPTTLAKTAIRSKVTLPVPEPSPSVPSRKRNRSPDDDDECIITDVRPKVPATAKTPANAKVQVNAKVPVNAKVDQTAQSNQVSSDKTGECHGNSDAHVTKKQDAGTSMTSSFPKQQTTQKSPEDLDETNYRNTNVTREDPSVASGSARTTRLAPTVQSMRLDDQPAEKSPLSRVDELELRVRALEAELREVKLLMFISEKDTKNQRPLATLVHDRQQDRLGPARMPTTEARRQPPATLTFPDQQPHSTTQASMSTAALELDESRGITPRNTKSWPMNDRRGYHH